MRRILLISNSSGIYIKKELEKQGFIVDFFNDKPNEGFICKTLGRIDFIPYRYVLTTYYKRIYEKIKKYKYDIIFFIRGEYVTEAALDFFRNKMKESKFILYMWDSVKNVKGIEGKWKFFDKVYSFDRMDCQNYKKEGVIFLPLFYKDEYRSQGRSSQEIYDFSFVGTAHGDRAKIVKSLKDKFEKCGKKFYIYLYSPHPLVFCFNKIFNKDYHGIKMSDISFKMLPEKKVIKIYKQSKCIIDIENKHQTGLTIRTLEVMGLKRKLITTNADIINYDFYHKENIFIMDRKEMDIDLGFIEGNYHEINKEIYEKYSISGWTQNILGI